ncbi:hypothetical protein CR205_13760 [Alteribacter lacisalsi]|uniref:Uncharacterized protein n=1 Tax=Alteribacter lacisalsi TaxID=2045244 RepID=A0A2W0H9J7_9BACI|nr:hypothetical protein [Alteribacter lacisalsi]PYZ96750.1 hypothetical protein CR205_13760 [Alteribacter lacisalsi]
MLELVRNNEEVFMIIYCFIILWINIEYLKEFKSIKKGLSELSSDQELDVTPDSLSLMLVGLVFNFVRRWLIYILAVLITGSTLVMIVCVFLFVISLYDCLFNFSLSRVKQSNLRLYLAIVDTILIAFFVAYLILSL